MKQVIIRLDDALHARLKEQAAAEGRSINEFVVAALTRALDSSTARRAFRERARAMGRLVVPDPPARIPSWSEVEALEAQRSAR